ncbi:hypothetical protein G7043_27330 [Lentzea sp. NEAU-D13]|uniref:Uncharacterized protein n=1 Tax=Lentzea alba TaxID=2714351 RepID=A0A7C9W117_9PSEU|nr:hypothetical protein [Lentzea alba]NGY62637.1 hypothetical protein [Lentzea alba]
MHDFGHGGFSRRRRRSGHHHDLSGAPLWVKAFVWAGTLLAIAGLGVVMYGVLMPTDVPVPAPPGFPSPPHRPTPSVGGPNLPLGFGLFFAGFVLTAIGTLGHSTSKRR